MPNSNPLNWIVPYSSVSNLNCASFHGHQLKLCLIPTPSNLIDPNSFSIKLKCALFHCQKIEFFLILMPHFGLCLIPLPLYWIVSYSKVAKWIMPYSNGLKLNCALFQPHQNEICLIPMSHNWDCALIQRPKIELCLIPMSPNWICALIQRPKNWIVPNSNVTKLNLCLIPMLPNWICAQFYGPKCRNW